MNRSSIVKVSPILLLICSFGLFYVLLHLIFEEEIALYWLINIICYALRIDYRKALRQWFVNIESAWIYFQFQSRLTKG